MTSVEREVRKGIQSEGERSELRTDKEKVRGERETGTGREKKDEIDEGKESVWRWQSEGQ